MRHDIEELLHHRPIYDQGRFASAVGYACAAAMEITRMPLSNREVDLEFEGVPNLQLTRVVNGRKLFRCTCGSDLFHVFISETTGKPIHTCDRCQQTYLRTVGDRDAPLE